MMKYTCFVVSPIGEAHSDIRQHSDDLFEMVIKMALQKYDFDIIRADKLNTPTSITSEIIKLIQEADLCIVDVTGQNANVMYECGRRHETGRPTILMAKNGEKLPFDINIMRTIFFRLDTPKNVHQATSTLKEFVDNIYKDGFSSKASGESLSTVIEVLNRIERKVNSITSHEVTNTFMKNGLENLNPEQALIIAVKQKNLSWAESLIPQLKVFLSPDIYYKRALPDIASIGSLKAAEILEKDIIPTISTYPENEQAYIISRIVNAYVSRDLESRGLEILKDYFEKMLNNRSAFGELRAALLNQKQRLLFGLGEEKYPEAMELLEEATKISPEPVYFYNYAVVAFKMEKYDLAEQYVMEGLKHYPDTSYNSDHVLLAVKILKQNGREKEYNKWKEWLETNAPLKLQLVDV